LKLQSLKNCWGANKSRPARGAWIETQAMPALPPQPEVAPRAGRVD